MTTDRARCPFCFLESGETDSMFWCNPPGGYRGQVVTPWDAGWWQCDTCSLRLNKRMAEILNAALDKYAQFLSLLPWR